ncbi:MAG TPA: DnaJ domain-containing protein [Burkholderiaceae bacterium]|nr:DnaJ domain-containing protein [Burkholderiaceae bacterium]
MPSSTDPYDLLGVPSTATAADVKQAFRRLAARWHPDRNPAPEAATRFREAQEAYELLIDPDRRRAHDEKRRRHLLEDPQPVARGLFEAYLAEIGS